MEPGNDKVQLGTVESVSLNSAYKIYKHIPDPRSDGKLN